MISMKDYASQSGLSYEAVRKKVNRYQKELEGHIKKQHRTRYLDDFAVQFLDSHRDQKAVQIIEPDEYCKILQEANMDLSKQLNDAYKKIVKLTEENGRLLSKEAEVKLLEEFREEDKARIEELQDELKQFEHIALGLYRRKK